MHFVLRDVSEGPIWWFRPHENAMSWGLQQEPRCFTILSAEHVSTFSNRSREALLKRFGLVPFPTTKQEQGEAIYEALFNHVNRQRRKMGAPELLKSSEQPVTQTESRSTTMPARKNDIDLDAVIRINPEASGRREGSKVAEIYKLYRNGMKVSTFLEKAKELGGGLGHVRRDIARGNITLEKSKKAA